MGTASPFRELIDAGHARFLGVARIESSERVQDREVVYELDPESGPRCLEGDVFRVAVRETGAADLVIYLQGGGACTSQLCQVTTVTTETVLTTGVPDAGILRPDLSANPVGEWNVLFAPYCDGSLMSGDRDVDLDRDGQIDRYFRGLRNLSAALDIAVMHFPDPQRIVLTGISAGGFATMVATPLVRFLYPQAELFVVNDSGVGVGTPGDAGLVASLAAEWGSTSALPASCDGCFSQGHLMPLVGWQLERDDRLRVGIISSFGDSVISSVFSDIGPVVFEEVLRQESAVIAARYPQRFRRFLFAGSKHTVLAIDAATDLSEAVNLNISIDPQVLDDLLGRFDVTAIDGVTVADWVRAMLEGGDWRDLVDGEPAV